jgi:hypothetical protein
MLNFSAEWYSGELARAETRQQQNSKCEYPNFNVPNAFCFRILDLDIVLDLDIST